VEALYASNTNPIINLMAVEGIRAMSQGLPKIQQNPRDEEARYKALYGAWLCGICLGAVDMALHHKLCHTVGGTFNLPHAETHVAILPHTLAYNASAAPEAMKIIATAFPESEGDAVRGINALYHRLGIEVSLKTLGMPEAGIEKAAELAAKNPYKNPATFEKESIRELIRRAWAGEAAS
jgi:alcohol dehydrogenase class IV